jgi:hypothetical protein
VERERTLETHGRTRDILKNSENTAETANDAFFIHQRLQRDATSMNGHEHRNLAGLGVEIEME